MIFGNVSLLVASAVDSEGFREILGGGAKEDKSGWSAPSVDRGPKGVQLVISDACRGLVRERRGFPAGGSLPTLHGAFLPQRLYL